MSWTVRFTGALLFLTLASPAWTAQHQEGFVYQDWILPSTAWRVDQLFSVQAIPDATFFNLFGRLENDDGYYMGVQQLAGGQRIGLVSLVDATEAIGTNCEDFGEQGDVGYKCTLPYAFVEGTVYELRFRSVSSNQNAGILWQGEIEDTATGTTTVIGTLRAAPNAGVVYVANNFNEYFGQPVACSAVPYSRVTFLPPVLNANSSLFGSPAPNPLIGTCSGGRVTPTIYGSSVLELGVPPACGIGPELLFVLAGLVTVRRRRVLAV